MNDIGRNSLLGNRKKMAKWPVIFSRPNGINIVAKTKEEKPSSACSLAVENSQKCLEELPLPHRFWKKCGREHSLRHREIIEVSVTGTVNHVPTYYTNNDCIVFSVLRVMN